MAGQQTVRVPQPKWQLIYNGDNISQDIESMVTEIRWHEQMGGQAAEMSFTVQDSQRKWMFSQYPTPSDTAELLIGYAGAPLFNCGTFMVDEFESTGPPDKLTVKCTESWMNAQIFTPTGAFYENMTFSQIAQSIAAKHGWTAVLASDPTQPDAPWNRKTQAFQDGGDLAFLQRLADESNYELNVRPPQLIFYSRPFLEAQPPTGTITRAMVKRYTFNFQSMTDRTYAGSSSNYFDPATKQLWGAQAAPTGSQAKNTSANVLNTKERMENNQQAALKAASILHEHNMQMFQGKLELPGTTHFRAGKTVALPTTSLSLGWGIYGGSWIIEEAEHTLRPGAGWVTNLTIRTAGAGTAITPAGAIGAT